MYISIKHNDCEINRKTIYSSFVTPSTSCRTCCIPGGPARQDLAEIASKIGSLAN